MTAIAPDTPEPIRRLIRSGAITTVAALAANLMIDALANALIDIPHRFTPLQPGSVAFLTIAGVIAATGAYRALSSRVSDPVRAFRRVVPVALVVSLLPDALIWATAAYDGTARAKTVLPLMAMHVAAAAACWALLPWLTTQRQPTS